MYEWWRSASAHTTGTVRLNLAEPKAVLTQAESNPDVLSGVAGYAIATISTGVMLLLRLLLQPYVHHRIPYSPFYVALLITLWLGGRGPALLVIGLGAVFGDWLSGGHLSRPFSSEFSLIATLIYFVNSGAILIFSQMLRSALRRAKEASRMLEQSRHELLELNRGLEDRVAERTTKLRETLGELQHISYSLTHDMRAPLRAMHSFAELLLADCGSQINHQGKIYLDRILGSATRLDNLILDALNFSVVAAAQTTLQPVDTEALLQGMLISYPQFQHPRADVRLEGALPIVLGNEALLTQCFSNLLDNAVKFVSPGARPQVRIFAETCGRKVRLCVADNGIGIPKEASDRIFRMFERAAKGYEGTGIGLAIVRKAVEKMGGQVRVESELGKGSKFWLELDRAEPLPA
jgi:signal transduction histidine kinase